MGKLSHRLWLVRREGEREGLMEVWRKGKRKPLTSNRNG